MDDKKIDEHRQTLVNASFPKKLFDLVNTSGDDIVKWEEHGRAFRIINPDLLAERILPLYFRHSKITSFQRQLNLYGFRRITKGEDQGAYYHSKFQRGKTEMVAEIRRLSGNTSLSHNDYSFHSTQQKGAIYPQHYIVKQPRAQSFDIVDFEILDPQPILDNFNMTQSFDNELRLQYAKLTPTPTPQIAIQPSGSNDAAVIMAISPPDTTWCRPELFEDFDSVDITMLDALFDENNCIDVPTA